RLRRHPFLHDALPISKAREAHDVVVAVVRFDETTRTIIDGRTTGFCKLIADRGTCTILGCHVVGERAVEITQVAVMAIAARMRLDRKSTRLNSSHLGS